MVAKAPYPVYHNRAADKPKVPANNEFARNVFKKRKKYNMKGAIHTPYINRTSNKKQMQFNRSEMHCNQEIANGHNHCRNQGLWNI
jgi:hypothetical protein